MNIKKPLVAKKNVINILSLILAGINSNRRIANLLKRKESTVFEHLAYLKDNNLIYTIENEKNNEKIYEVNIEKIIELYLIKYFKNEKLLKYKRNDLVILTFVGIIFIKKGLLEKNPEKFNRINLIDIFSEAHMNFYYRGRELQLGNESIALQDYKFENDKIKEEFKEFLILTYQHFQKVIEEEKREEKRKIEEEKRKKEENMIIEGKKISEKIPLNVKFDTT